MTEKIWKEILAELGSNFSKPIFDTWLKPTSLFNINDDIAIISVSNLYNKTWFEKEALDLIKPHLLRYYPGLTKFDIIIENKNIERKIEDLPLWDNQPAEEIELEPAHNPLNQKYTFDSFVVGNNNRLAFAAAQVVADKPGKAYNPLFIYGGVGLGKTHLMHAIGNQILHNNPRKKITSISCETFASEFIQSIQNKTINDFKQKYRNVDVFLVDDIQFLANKEGTQEEFFHTFNNLHQSEKQIIMTADRVPKDIPQLEDRLRSRFGWGMVADIQAPNYETRVAILKNKLDEKNFKIDDEVVNYIAEIITDNIRELEGSLTKLIAASELENKEIDTEYCAAILKDLSRTERKPASAKKILAAVCAYFDIENIDLIGNRRTKDLVYPRQVAMYLMRELAHLTYPQTGDALGGKDHTTIMHGFNKIVGLYKSDEKVEQDIKTIKNQIK